MRGMKHGAASLWPVDQVSSIISLGQALLGKAGCMTCAARQLAVTGLAAASAQGAGPMSAVSVP